MMRIILCYFYPYFNKNKCHVAALTMMLDVGLKETFFQFIIYQ